MIRKELGDLPGFIIGEHKIHTWQKVDGKLNKETETIIRECNNGKYEEMANH